MRVTVCELPDERQAFAAAWRQLANHVHAERSGLLILPEMIGSSWFPVNPAFDRATWQRAVQEHDKLMDGFQEVEPAMVVGSRPLDVGGLRLNRAFVWSAETGVQYIHDKYYMPDEPAYFETHWFDQPSRDFSVATVRGMAFGAMICTDVMFNEWARHYGRKGAVLLAVPRTSDPTRLWGVALAMAAVASGAFVLSSNRDGPISPGKRYGGAGMIISPDGTVLATTSSERPFVTLDIDLDEAVAAKDTYPRYVPE